MLLQRQSEVDWQVTHFSCRESAQQVGRHLTLNGFTISFEFVVPKWFILSHFSILTNDVYVPLYSRNFISVSVHKHRITELQPGWPVFQKVKLTAGSKKPQRNGNLLSIVRGTIPVIFVLVVVFMFKVFYLHSYLTRNKYLKRGYQWGGPELKPLFLGSAFKNVLVCFHVSPHCLKINYRLY